MNNETSAEIAQETEVSTKTPTEKKYRYWCGTCGDYEIFSLKEDHHICNKCSSKKVEVELSIIPEEKIKEQQDRFRNMRRTDFARMMEVYQFMGQNPNAEMPMLESDSIYETDAGLLAIEKVEREKREAEQQAILEDIAAHKGIGRNEKCPCLSGKKYKQCCLKRIEGYYRR
jgi:uncharacterized protein YecA (UPF0149 family)